MIPSSAALPVVFGERLLVLRSEQRQVVGQEPPLEQQSEGQPGYLEGSLVLLCHFSPATPYRGDGSGRSKTAADRRSAVGGLSGCDCRSAGACRPRGRGAGLLHRPAAAR